MLRKRKKSQFVKLELYVTQKKSMMYKKFEID